ncbi:MAG: DUF2628 domain-containing protein [Saprospiraceae bacterium]|nr:DUF2628 domain-containing protein [Saprospiraceae bacterium]
MTEDIELYEAFFQKSKSYYLDKLMRFNTGQEYRFNFFAFLFGLFWFVYRKMYVEAFIIIAFIIIEGLVEELVVPESLSKVANIIATLAISTITGFLGNNLYIRKAHRTIIEAKEKFQDMEAQKTFLAKKGGVSFIVLIALFLLIFGVVFYNKYQAGMGH